MQAKLGPAAIIVALMLAVGIIGTIGYKAVLKPPASTSGIGPDGKPMSQAQIDELARKMSGGKYQKAPTSR